MTHTFRYWRRDSGGQDLVEYGLLAALVSVASILAVQMLGLATGQLWTRLVAQLVLLFQ